MIPGEMKIEQGEITLNEGRQILTILVANAGDRPIQVGSHYHFFEVNPCLSLSVTTQEGSGSTYQLALRCGLSLGSNEQLN